MQELKKVVIIGPESTGKSTLCGQLSKYYQTLWCPEFARQYLVSHGPGYTYDDLLTISKGQVDLEEEYISRAIRQEKTREPGHSLLFFDTDLYVMKVWSEYVYAKCHLYILDTIAKRTCELYLLTNIDLPWVQDEFREYPDLQSRKELFHIYKDILINQKVPWTIISGNFEERLHMALASINKVLVI